MDTRETRDHAREAKFLIDAKLRPAIVEWSRANLEPDGHGAGVYADEYTTASLYFETDGFDVYCRKESYGRSKYRIRRYGLSDIIFLERKFRTDRLLAKRRTTVPVSDLERLASDRPDISWAGYWFHRRVLLRRLRPLIQMSYDRVARVGTSSTGPVRMTIDHNLRVLPMPDRAFIPGVGLSLIEDKCIIEIKYRREIPAVFKRLAEEFGVLGQRVSKYRLGLTALDYPLPRRDEGPPHTLADLAGGLPS
jgi:VTC domain